jgi:DNA-binding transcriptional LysR family regulator
MALTPAGSALAERILHLLDQLDAALRETTGAASRAAHVLRVGFVASATDEQTQQIIAAATQARYAGRLLDQSPLPGAAAPARWRSLSGLRMPYTSRMR